jgi:hypothetical protein
MQNCAGTNFTCNSAAQSYALSFEITGQEPCEGSGGMPIAGFNGDGDYFTFSTDSSFVPFLVSSTASASGLAGGIVATPSWLYLTSVGANSITEIGIATYAQSGSVNVYQ